MNERAPLPRTRLEGPSRRFSGTRGLARSERGTAIVEFALIAPLLFFLVFGIIEFGRALNYYNDLTQLAGQGARAAIVSRNPDSTAVGTANANCAANNQTIQCQIAKTFPTDNQLKTGMSVCLGTLNTSTGVITAPTTRADHRGSGHRPDEVPVPLPDEPLRRLDHLDLDANRAARGRAHLGRGQRRRHRRERVPAMRSHRSPESERGAVIVMVAIWLPVLALFVSFAVDFAHFFDYSRNLQNRADAAALAASVAYGNTCFSNPTAAQTDAIGKVAQQYAGPPIQNPGSPYTVPNNLPYAYSGSGSPNAVPERPEPHEGNTAELPHAAELDAELAQRRELGNGNDRAQHEQPALCSSRDEDGNVGPMIDVRLTQANLGLFFPLFNFSPSISAHARAGLQGEASTTAAPIAVGDTGQIPCVSARLVNATTNALIQTVTLTKKPPDPLNPTAPVQWDNTAAPASFTMPASDNVYVQPFLSDCNGNGAVYDDGWPNRPHGPADDQQPPGDQPDGGERHRASAQCLRRSRDQQHGRCSPPGT